MRVSSRLVNRRRWGREATTLFLASTVPFGIAAHLVSEFAGLGWHDDADVLFSARHAYLAVAAIAVFAAFVAALLRVPPAGRRARIASLVDDLPFRGRGARFTALSFATQFAFFAVTQIGEGCPLCAGDVFVGVVAAALAAVAGALAIALGQRRVIAFVCAIAGAFRTRRSAAQPAISSARSRSPRVRAAFARALTFRYRPPPQEAV